MKKEKEEIKKDSLVEAIDDLRKQFGVGVVLTDEDIPIGVEAFSTGSFALDGIMGSGLPVGRITEIYGEPSGGKTTLSLFIAGQFQKQGKKIVYIDAEQSFDAVYAKNLGVDVKKLIVSQTDSLEDAFSVMTAFAKTGQIDLIICDSVASLVPKSELEEGAIYKEGIAVQARALSRNLRMLTGVLAKSKTTLLMINQTRTAPLAWGAKEISAGGKALKFYSSIRLSVTRSEKIKGKGDEQIGAKLKITAVKNKVAFPFKSCTVDLYFSSGIDLVADALDKGEELKIVNKTGNTYEFEGNKIGVGRDQTIEVLRGSKEMYDKLVEAIKEKIKDGKKGD